MLISSQRPKVLLDPLGLLLQIAESWKSSPGPLEKQPVHLTTESLQTNNQAFVLIVIKNKFLRYFTWLSEKQNV